MEEARVRLAAAVRDLVDHIVQAQTDEKDFREALGHVEKAIDALEHAPRRGFKAPNLPDTGDLQATFWMDPIIGKGNPIAPPFDVEVKGDRVHARGTFGSAYEGPPGHVHGAMIAAAFDQVLGICNVASGVAGFTGTLTIRYRRPTPLHAELEMEAWLDRIEGRKGFISGHMKVGGQISAEAEGIFIRMRHDKALEFFRNIESW